MPEQFVNVFKANSHIRELDAQLTKVTAELATAKTELATAQATIAAYDPTLEATAAQLQTDLTKASADLVSAQASIVALTKERDEAKAILSDPKAEIAKRASAQAATITASQGQPVPVTTGVVASPGGTNDILTQINATSDPVEKAKLIQKNMAAIRSGFIASQTNK